VEQVVRTAVWVDKVRASFGEALGLRSADAAELIRSILSSEWSAEISARFAALIIMAAACAFSRWQHGAERREHPGQLVAGDLVIPVEIRLLLVHAPGVAPLPPPTAGGYDCPEPTVDMLAGSPVTNQATELPGGLCC
jgi:hypothetical protein